jgi:hypothetical protein
MGVKPKINGRIRYVVDTTRKINMTSTLDVTNEAVVEPQADGQQQQVDSKDENIRNMREIIKANSSMIARQNQQLDEMNARFLASQQKQQDPEEDYFHGLDDDDALGIKEAKAIVPRAVDKAVKKALAERDRAQEQTKNKFNEAVDSAKRQYSDFDEVMAKDNVDSIITNSPAVYRVISSSPDPIDAAYQYIKNSAVYDRKKSSKGQNMVEKAKLQENQNKPKSPNGVAPTSNVAANINAETGNFTRLTKDQQKELWTEHNKKLGRRQ